MKMVDPEQPPNPPIFKNENIKKRYQHAKSMAVDAVNLPKIERIEKYSFASLYTGKWGERVDTDDSDDLETDIDTRLIGIPSIKQHAIAKKKSGQRKLKNKDKKTENIETDDEDSYGCSDSFHCLMCLKKLRFSRKLVENHLKKHRYLRRQVVHF